MKSFYRIQYCNSILHTKIDAYVHRAFKSLRCTREKISSNNREKQKK